MRRRWLESKVHLVAPIDVVAEEEMGIDDDGESREVQERNHVRMNLEMNHHHTTTRSATKFNTTRSRNCTSAQLDTSSISELVRSVCGVERQK